MTGNTILVLRTLLITLWVLEVHSVNIQFYQHLNFNGLIWQSNISKGCENIPRSENANIFSIRTDTCIIAYNKPDCWYRLSMKYMPGDINLLPNQVGRDGYIQSFRTCNEEEGGSQLNVDITRYYPFYPVGYPKVLESYKNVCSCVEVPKYVQKLNKWSIHNHHNTMLAYYESNCSTDKWSPKFLAAEHWTDSNNMDTHRNWDSVTRTEYKIQSFGPDPNSVYFQTSCNFSQVRFTTENWKLFGNENLEDMANAAESSTLKNLCGIFPSVFSDLALKLVFAYLLSTNFR